MASEPARLMLQHTRVNVYCEAIGWVNINPRSKTAVVVSISKETAMKSKHGMRCKADVHWLNRSKVQQAGS